MESSNSREDSIAQPCAHGPILRPTTVGEALKANGPEEATGSEVDGKDSIGDHKGRIKHQNEAFLPEPSQPESAKPFDEALETAITPCLTPHNIYEEPESYSPPSSRVDTNRALHPELDYPVLFVGHGGHYVNRAEEIAVEFIGDLRTVARGGHVSRRDQVAAALPPPGNANRESRKDAIEKDQMEKVKRGVKGGDGSGNGGAGRLKKAARALFRRS